MNFTMCALIANNATEQRQSTLQHSTDRSNS